MLAAFRSWLSRHRARKAAWHQAWSGADVYGDDGLTNFQRLALASLEQALGPLSLVEAAGTAGRYLTGKIPETYFTLYLYADELGAQGISQRFIREKWDCDTPEAMVGEFVAFVRSQPRNRF
ncbi:MAG TPA: hypothetical protein VGO37_10350 [Steroidobacteraceae bacterium]|jgi:hypothetical protein|nr:hypothetical protein [Steroidobacteraceae bacterium]